MKVFRKILSRNDVSTTTHQSGFLVPVVEARSEIFPSLDGEAGVRESQITVFDASDGMRYLGRYVYYESKREYRVTHLKALFLKNRCAAGDEISLERIGENEFEFSLRRKQEHESILSSDTSDDSSDDILSAIEGELGSPSVKRKRCSELRLAALKKWGNRCSCCGYSFADDFDGLRKDCIEIHHLNQLALNPGRLVTVDDLRPLCPNCHRAIHTRDPAYSITELKKMYVGGRLF
jgi:hypothetical protein